MLRTGLFPASGFVQQIAPFTSPCLLISVQGYHKGAATRWVQIHNKTSLSGGEVPVHSWATFAQDNFFVLIPQSGFPLDKCVIALSTTADTYTAGAADMILSATVAPL